MPLTAARGCCGFVAAMGWGTGLDEAGVDREAGVVHGEACLT